MAQALANLFFLGFSTSLLANPLFILLTSLIQMTSNIIQLTLNIIQLKLLANQTLLEICFLSFGFFRLLTEQFCINLLKIINLFLKKALNFFLLNIKII
ncbi:Uncharacterised protein [Streptococcus pneumoniae]|nr:Uncharacterised protein [Streptococcus pneumoniae]